MIARLLLTAVLLLGVACASGCTALADATLDVAFDYDDDDHGDHHDYSHHDYSHHTHHSGCHH